MTSGDGPLAEPQNLVEDDVSVPVPESGPVTEWMRATSASASVDVVLGPGSGPQTADRIPQRLDRSVEDVIAAHTLARQRDDDTSTARQSA
jgi:hypothetical protein